MSILINILLVIHVLISLLIILLVLMQRPKNEGLGAAFGGGMTDNLFGAQTTNVLQSGTRWLGGIFFALTLLLSFLYVRSGSARNSAQKALQESSEAATKPAPDPSKELEDKIKRAIEDGKSAPPPATPTEVEKKSEGTELPPAPKPDEKLGEPKPAPPNPEGSKEEPPKPAPADPKPPEPPK